MKETIGLLEDIIIKNKASTPTDAVSLAIQESNEWLSLKEKTELFRLAEVQYKNKILQFFKEDKNG